MINSSSFPDIRKKTKGGSGGIYPVLPGGFEPKIHIGGSPGKCLIVEKSLVSTEQYFFSPVKLVPLIEQKTKASSPNRQRSLT